MIKNTGKGFYLTRLGFDVTERIQKPNVTGGYGMMGYAMICLYIDIDD